jgi:Reverse transcriptase (RNA-dependent DNA polymerase)
VALFPFFPVASGSLRNRLHVTIDSLRSKFTIASAGANASKNAFLHGKTDLEIYVQQPEGFLDREFPNKVLRLNKSLYGLK